MTNWTAADAAGEREIRERLKASLHEWAMLAMAPQGHAPAAHHRLLIRELE
jgi:hypothetical protein